MRDLVLREGLKTMAGDASLLLRDLLASGAEIPYEVRESGNGSPLAEYVPQTSRFIRDSADKLSMLDSFGTACAALEADDLAGPYLAEMGVPVPADTRRRAELSGVVFLCRMWQGSTDFTLDDLRLETTIDEVLDLGEASLGEVEIAVPLRGFRMDVERLELTGATIVRADTVEVPAEARGADGMGGAAWEPPFLVVARVDAVGATEVDGSDIGIRAVEAFKRVVTTLRIFKSGGVSLGPHAWVKAGGDRWRRVSTGAGRPRPGGYRVAETELADLAALSRGLAHRSTPFQRIAEGQGGFPATLARAISRYEAGLERTVTVEALNDYLLTLRFLLEGGGPASLGMPMRVASLCAEPDERTQVKSTIDRAVALERELWSGEPAVGTGGVVPAEGATEVEEMTRAILRDAALGHLGSDLRITADEILLGEGLMVGEGAGVEARGETAEWRPAEASEPEAITYHDDEDFTEVELETELEEAMRGSVSREAEAEDEITIEPDEEAPEPMFNRAQNLIHDLEPDISHDDFEWSEPAPRAERDEEENGQRRFPVTSQSTGGPFEADDAFERAGEPEPEVRILRAVPDEGPVAALIADSDNHRREVHDRVSFLFPRPETTEWSVREVGYDRNRRARPSDPDQNAS